MKAEELRIGNYVDGKKRYEEQYIEVESIDYEQINIHFRSYYFIDLNAIPLTKDWLLKFNFQYLNNHYIIAGLVIWEINGVFLCDKNGIVIKYVHQIQNLYFALTGEELILNK